MIVRLRVSARRGASAVGFSCLAVAAALGASAPSSAATFEQIQQSCRETVGKPIVQACMQAQAQGHRQSGSLPHPGDAGGACLHSKRNVEDRGDQGGTGRAGREGRRAQGRRGRAGDLRRAAAHDRRHHGDPRPGKARPGQDREAQGRRRRRAGQGAVENRAGAVLLRPRQCPRRAGTDPRSPGRRRKGAGGRARAASFDRSSASASSSACSTPRSAIRRRRWRRSRSPFAKAISPDGTAP